MLFATLAVTLLGGTALADRDGRGGWNRGRDRRGPVVRDHRNDHRWNNRRPVVVRRAPRYRIERRPVYANRNRFVFHGGITRVYNRPVIRYRYYDYRVRPQVLVENIEPVPGYIWVSGQWSWSGQEWLWNPGHYAVDPNYQYSQYDYDGDGYPDPASADQQYPADQYPADQQQPPPPQYPY